MRRSIRRWAAAAILVAVATLLMPSATWSAPGAGPPPGLAEASVTRAAIADSTASGPTLAPAVSFTASEKVLLRTIPSRIRGACVPRRSDLPRGTAAAVQCRPAARVVRDMAYYLLEADQAERVFEQRRAENGVAKGRRCVSGKTGVSYWIGGMPTSELCYRNEDRRANLRFLEPATRCEQLKVAGRTLRAPTVYVAVLSGGRDIGRLARWATDDGRARPSVLARTISQPGSRPSPACPR